MTFVNFMIFFVLFMREMLNKSYNTLLHISKITFFLDFLIYIIKLNTPLRVVAIKERSYEDEASDRQKKGEPKLASETVLVLTPRPSKKYRGAIK